MSGHENTVTLQTTRGQKEMVFCGTKSKVNKPHEILRECITKFEVRLIIYLQGNVQKTKLWWVDEWMNWQTNGQTNGETDNPITLFHSTLLVGKQEVQFKTLVTPLLTRWSYQSLVLSHPNNPYNGFRGYCFGCQGDKLPSLLPHQLHGECGIIGFIWLSHVMLCPSRKIQLDSNKSYWFACDMKV